jgi:hypothetical protein
VTGNEFQDTKTEAQENPLLIPPFEKGGLGGISSFSKGRLSGMFSM